MKFNKIPPTYLTVFSCVLCRGTVTRVARVRVEAAGAVQTGSVVAFVFIHFAVSTRDPNWTQAEGVSRVGAGASVSTRIRIAEVPVDLTELSLVPSLRAVARETVVSVDAGSSVLTRVAEARATHCNQNPVLTHAG